MKGALAALMLGLPLAAHTATIQFNYGAGFDDSTATPAVGGNTGTTRGEQRRILFEAAGQIWADLIVSNVPIVIDAEFVSLPCSMNGAALGFAGPRLTASGNGPWNPRSLADALAGSDITGTPDIEAQFNIDVDNGCFGGGPFYYGLDDNTPSNMTPLFNTVLHELAHGLGFSGSVQESAMPGELELLGDRPSVFDLFVLDLDLNLFVDEMSAAQLNQAGVNDPSVVFAGPTVDAQAENFLTGGLNAGTARIYAPATFEPGSSMSHFSTDSTPNLLMEPFAEDQAFDQVDITPFLFQDLGYTVNIGPVDELFSDGFEDP